MAFVRARSLLWSLLAAVLLLGAAEIVVRLVHPEPAEGLLAYPPLLALYAGVDRPDEIFSSVNHDALEWSPYLHWAMRPNLRTRFFNTNARGFRGPEVEVPKPAGTFRIVVMGGSVAWGYGATADGNTLAGRLQAELRERLPGRGVEVVNAGQSGFVSGQEVVYFHRSVSALAPDLVLLFDGYNDVEADLTNPATDLPQNAPQLRTRYDDFLRSGRLAADMGRALHESRLLQLVERQLKPSRPAAPWTPLVEPSATAATYGHNVSALARLAAPARVWVALQPVLATIEKPLAPEEQRLLARRERLVSGYRERVRAAYRGMAAAAAHEGLPVIALDDALGREPLLLFVDECHCGDEAFRRMARVIASELVTRGAIPGSSAPPP